MNLNWGECLENVVLILVAGFLAWHFGHGWPLVILLLANMRRHGE